MYQVIPNIAFLGFCNHVQKVAVTPYLIEHNILGLSQIVSSFVYPLPLKNQKVAFAVYDAKSFKKTRLSFVSSTNEEELFYLDIHLTSVEELTLNIQANSSENTDGTTLTVDVVDSPMRTLVHDSIPGWSFLVAELPEKVGIVKLPGLYKVIASNEDFQQTVGFIEFSLLRASPLSPDRIAAIQSKPYSAKEILFTISCNKCGEEFRLYTALNRKVKLEVEGWCWYQEVPDRFNCSCGKTKDIDLTIARTNMHGLLGAPTSKIGAISYTRLYEKDILDTVYVEFKSLLATRPKEEQVQKFIEENPIILQQFAPERVFYKKPILTKYITDIAVLNQKRELLLIELERPTIPLLTKKGGTANPLQHAFDQANDWLHIVDDHRIAVLTGFDLQPDIVTQIRGVVIAGRDGGYEKSHLRRIKSTDYGRINFYTYDDLLFGLGNLIRGLEEL